MENRVREFQNGFIGKFFVKKPILFVICFILMLFVFIFICHNVHIPIYEEVNGSRIKGTEDSYRLEHDVNSAEGAIFFYVDKSKNVYSCDYYVLNQNVLELKTVEQYQMLDDMTFEIQTRTCTLLEAVFVKGGNI